MQNRFLEGWQEGFWRAGKKLFGGLARRFCRAGYLVFIELLDLGPFWLDLGPFVSLDLGPFVGFGPMFAGFGPIRLDLGPFFNWIWAHSVGFGPIWLDLGPFSFESKD